MPVLYVKVIVKFDVLHQNAFHSYSVNNAIGKLGEGIGHYHFEKTSNNEFKVTCENPYSYDFDKSLLKGAVEKFKTPNQKVEFMENVKSGCRNNGHAKCTFHIIIK